MARLEIGRVPRDKNLVAWVAAYTNLPKTCRKELKMMCCEVMTLYPNATSRPPELIVQVQAVLWPGEGGVPGIISMFFGFPGREMSRGNQGCSGEPQGQDKLCVAASKLQGR